MKLKIKEYLSKEFFYMAGWQKIYRDIQDHWLWEDKPFSRGQAWIDLILLVNHEDNKTLIDGELIEVKRGSKITSLRKLADQWGWSTTKVKKFLELLQKEQMIKFESDNKKTLVSIENYSVYQSKDNTENTVKKQSDNTEVTQKNFKSNSEVIQKKTNKNDKEYIKNDKEEEEERKEVYQLQSLSFPTPLHEKIFNQFGDVTYKTWFKDLEVIEADEEIIINFTDKFKKQIVEDKYIDSVKMFTGKTISTELKNGDE
ncbi:MULTISPECIES: DnaA N-terminal domain-containing protein [Clostridium]|uniref:DnaA N-terminal domain-containing protein n=3 Tax=Clostridium TaxID=1485 RepID=UPI0017BB289B|nr:MULTISPECIES: DnaA N-terminal domain-containing protein [Clostridium]MBA8971413.1 DNA-binding transcriptional regulator YhcF (GntR family) [Clostridium butyricum]MDU2679381.1 DnaA N-terminal domain-containing protein [Clostridium sp.]MDU4211624.1 DnaA N-terminal domain-containing protein [Clostridium sp.]MDU7122329.1 DnaA N-terminal domain-containing protein [Clostridium sp.]MDU7178159.1 DnaA N-terminal domain-containing protein [Clostridium sp.]